MLLPKNINIININPDEINLDNRDFYIPSFDALSNLIVSIQNVGILNSPLVKRDSSGLFVPILGRRRIQALSELDNRATIEVRVAPPDLANDQAFLLAFWDNQDRIRRDAGVRAYVISRLLEMYPAQTLAKYVFPSLNVPARGPSLERIRKIGALEHNILEAFSCGKINEKSAVILAEMQSDQREVLFDLISRLALNANKAFELISNLFDLSVYWNESITDLLRRPEAMDALDNEGIGATEKATLLRDLVRRWKFPEISRDRKNFDEWVKDFNPPANINLRPSQSFEDDSVYVEIRVPSRSHVRELVKIVLGFEEQISSLKE